jgi:hypothetical protein
MKVIIYSLIDVNHIFPRQDSVSLHKLQKMLTLKEQLDAEVAERNKPSAPKINIPVKAPLFGNPYRLEYIKNAEAMQEKLLKRGKSARPSKKKKLR